MTKKEEPFNQPSLREQLEASRRINRNIAEGLQPQPRGKAKPADEEEEETIIPAKMKKAELQAALKEAGIAFETDANKDRLVELYSDYLADHQDDGEEEGGEGDDDSGDGAGAEE